MTLATLDSKVPTLRLKRVVTLGQVVVWEFRLNEVLYSSFGQVAQMKCSMMESESPTERSFLMYNLLDKIQLGLSISYESHYDLKSFEDFSKFVINCSQIPVPRPSVKRN